jgi:hypothetical protein
MYSLCFCFCSWLLVSAVLFADGAGKTRRSLALEACGADAGLNALALASAEPVDDVVGAVEEAAGVSDSAADTSDGLGDAGASSEGSVSSDEDDSRDEDYVASERGDRKHSRDVKGMRRVMRPRVGSSASDSSSVGSAESTVVAADAAPLPEVLDDPD